MIDDNNFLLPLKQGDKAVFEIIFKDYYRKLCTYARGFLGDANEAEDIVSEFFVSFWENRKNLEINSSLKSYLFKSIKNRCMNYIKHLSVKDKYKSIILTHYQEDLYIDKSDKYSDIDYNSLQKKIDEIIETLPNQCKRVYLMSRYDEKKYDEIANELNISRNAVKKHIVKALEIFRINLRDAELFSMFLAILLNT